MWRIFELVYASFKSVGFQYLEEMLPSLDNCVSFGSDVIAQNTHYQNMLVDIFETAMTSSEFGANDRVTACKLGEAILLNMRGQADSILPILLNRTFSIITRQNESEEPIITNALFLHSLELIVNGLFYNPLLTIAILDHANLTAIFFTKWFANISKFTRVHDRKLGIMAIAAILEVLPSAPAAISQASTELLVGALTFFKDLPEAISARLEAEKDITAIGEEDEEAEEEQGVNGKEESDVDDDQDVELDDDEDDLLGLIERHRGSGDDNDAGSDAESDDESDAFSEERLFASPLDQIDAYSSFVKTLSRLEAQHPSAFQHITSTLSPGQRNALNDIVAKAQIGGEKAVTDQQKPAVKVVVAA